MKKLLFTLMACAALVISMPVKAQLVPASPAVGVVACTNNTPNNATTIANMGSAIDCSRYNEVGLQLKYELDAAGTTACTFNFARSADGTNYQTTGYLAFPLVPAGTVTVCTNINVTLGALPYLKLVNIVSANNTANMTNIQVVYVMKPERKE